MSKHAAGPEKEEVVRYVVDELPFRIEVSEVRYEYHRNTPWREFAPDRPGVDIVNQWLVYEGGRLTGRLNPGYARLWERLGDGHFTRREDAVAYAKGRIAERVLAYRRQLAEAETNLEAIR